jgi:hypothetical protein
MFCVKLQSVYSQVFLNHTTNHISTKFKEFNFNLSYEYYEYDQICIVHLRITLSSFKVFTCRYFLIILQITFPLNSRNLILIYHMNIMNTYKICILHLCIILSLKTIQYDILHTDVRQLRLSTISLTTKWDSKWLLLDDKSNPYIDENKISHKLVAG